MCKTKGADQAADLGEGGGGHRSLFLGGTTLVAFEGAALVAFEGAALVAFEGAALVAFEGATLVAFEGAADRHEPPHPAKLAGQRAADEREPLLQHGASV